MNGITHDNVYRYVGKPFRWIWAVIGRHRLSYAISMVITCLLVTFSVIPSTIAGRLIDEVLNGGQFDRLWFYLPLMVAFPFTRSMIGVLIRYFYERASQDGLMRLRDGLYGNLQSMDRSFYDSTRTGDLMTIMGGDLDMIRHFMSFVMWSSVEQVVIFVFGAAYLFSINWILALTAVLFAPFIGFFAFRLGSRVRPLWQQVRRQFSALNSVVTQNIGGNRIVKAFARADFEETKFERENEAYREANIESGRIWTRYIPILDGMANFLTIPTILVGGYLVIRGKMSMGELVTFNGLLFLMSNPMRQSGWLINDIQRFVASAERILDLLIARSRVVSPENGRKEPIRGEVEFRDLSFAYPDFSLKNESQGRTVRQTPALDHVSFVAHPGQTIGIIGLTGSGKSTLIQLMSRFYDPTGGQILVDGVDLREYDLDTLRRSIGLVSQDVFLFSDTAEGNIAYGNPEMPFDDVVHAAQVAQADGFIRKMPDGYDTIVGERGVGLSGGQRQRISLARALAYNPSILLLDDTTSAVDMETEAEIQEALTASYSDKSVFIVAHRISSVRHADLILVLKDGAVAESGNHESLVRLGGIYADVYHTQLGDAVAEGGN
ncbi:MAG: ABC transporter ATP-binding protein [Clostridiaceae bacterium]|jgi:ATP-binding cassette subfamily B protein|nr:ABC transporter ATP-binding protein [Clostridiaceae bacterium]